MEPKKYEFVEINNFIVANGSAEHYEADFKLYRKLFPESRILKDLENPFPPQKKELDERMLYEILNADRICIETILENRGIIVAPKTDEAHGKFETVDSAKELLAGVDLSTLKYNEAKALIFKLKLKVPNQSAETLRAALAEVQAAIVADLTTVPPITEEPVTDGILAAAPMFQGVVSNEGAAQTDDAVHTDDAATDEKKS